ncbi:hypothetical protein JWG39_03625 [Desulforhopalus vacuolatus]|uniref:hypothetical protein n=1 Tax=Desulforhopalus vacuolatus TaxID=40414 RepID=UPI0019652D32|nr:hypothetical protein [Desulforhopalus vacuolatus]MBM9518903.1 hypothetical protein [Desulforhopalus vacuolatus]
MSENATTQPNWFVRALIVGLALVMITMACFAFFKGEPQFALSPSLLSLLGLIIVLCVSESFDNLSLGKLISLQRKVEEQASDKASLSEENAGLRGQLLTLVSNVQQRQVNATFNAPPDSWGNLLGVVQAKEPVEEESSDAESDEQESSPAQVRTPSGSGSDRVNRWRAAETLALRAYFDRLDIPTSERIRDAEFSTNFHGIDPIMDRRIVFDAYVRGDNKEHFVEAMRANSHSFMMADRLYVMLNKIRLYKQAKSTDADLTLIFVELEDDDEDRPVSRRANRILEFFQPAIANKLLKVETVGVSAEEIDEEISDGQRALL